MVLDAYSRRVVGWAIDPRQRADLATSALGMAIDSRGVAGQVTDGIIHGDHGTQFTCWTFTERARRAGLLPSLGTIDDPYDNAVAEAFWGRMQTELLDRQRWRTRIELANAIFEYIEGSTTAVADTSHSTGSAPQSSKQPPVESDLLTGESVKPGQHHRLGLEESGLPYVVAVKPCGCPKFGHRP